MKNEDLDQETIEKLQKQHNPNNESVGHFTGRCAICHSKDLWDDATAYGCNCCGAIFMTGDIMPKVIENSTGRVFEFEEIYGTLEERRRNNGL